jgi:hypothetical protein
MSKDRTLLVGYDLCDDNTQISCFNQKTGDIESICMVDDTDNPCIPTLLAVKKDSKEWLFGKDAIRCQRLLEGVLVDHLVKHTIEKEKITIYGVEFSHESIWEKYFKKSLSLLKRYYPNDSIWQLVITIERMDPYFVQTIYQALENLGIYKERVAIQSHAQSYIYYALSQKKELWLNDVGLFEFNENGLFYSQISINRKISPMVVGVEEKDFSDTLHYHMLEQQEETESISYIFENIAKGALHKQIISTLFITGKGFEGQWPDRVIKELCMGRRVFKGQNLFAHGACYTAKELKGDKTLEEFIYFSEDRIPCNITMNVYSDAKIQEAILAKAGTAWYDAGEHFEVIPDQEDELQIIVKDILRKEEKRFSVTLEGLSNRPNKTTRISIRTSFVDVNTMVITMKDKGFGMLFPSTNRIWEKRITLG